MTLVIPAGVNVAACATQAATRWTYDLVHVMPAAGGMVAVATDGVALSCVRLDGPRGDGFFVPAHFFWSGSDDPDARRELTCDGETVSLTERDRGDTVTRTGAVKPGAPPPYGKIPRGVAGGDYRRVALDAQLLSRLASALSPDRVVELFVPPDPDKPVCVIGACGFGVLATVNLAASDAADFDRLVSEAFG